MENHKDRQQRLLNALEKQLREWKVPEKLMDIILFDVKNTVDLEKFAFLIE